jgi:hypothetical protein
MTKLRRKLRKEFELKRLAKSTAAVSGLAGAASAATGVAAALAAPTGLTALAVVLGISSAPLIVSVAPIVAGVAVAAGTAAGVVRFCHWYKERSEEDESTDGSEP